MNKDLIDKKKYFLKNVLISIIILFSLRYIPVGKLKIQEIVTIISTIMICILLSDIILPTIIINESK